MSVTPLTFQNQASYRLTVMEGAMQVALTGLVCIPFTPRTSFETGFLGSKARSKTAPQAWAVPHGDWNYGQLVAAIVTKKSHAK
ncbi:hypothetical protein [Lactiplantibacillus fabifermentans]|uniref:Uncharacterized protein n=2 Tax=Lactiplantibacillus fabifermentans TaxID=483011 RepID=A0A0R2NP19_9LACO|nr:hypothetical protein [Lactiplantibacillus fabifermentans]ETY75527.1 hypothetical protein LFAB_01435 [Lactiplantibacillus fabifermentans T30PCM01]KRO27132.1 hypothetical protein DY78_GL000324 [Lactiplantibacillus fabifermentans DSM 21115]